MKHLASKAAKYFERLFHWGMFMKAGGNVSKNELAAAL